MMSAHDLTLGNVQKTVRRDIPSAGMTNSCPHLGWARKTVVLI